MDSATVWPSGSYTGDPCRPSPIALPAVPCKLHRLGRPPAVRRFLTTSADIGPPAGLLLSLMARSAGDSRLGGQSPSTIPRQARTGPALGPQMARLLRGNTGTCRRPLFRAP
jgi:hypothetical protein